jgi:hypothetical protein
MPDFPVKCLESNGLTLDDPLNNATYYLNSIEFVPMNGSHQTKGFTGLLAIND